MRHKYPTKGIVLARLPLGEANLSVSMLTEELGLVRARAQGARKSGAKLSAALQVFAESEFNLVRGAEGVRVTGAVLAEQWFSKLSRAARLRAARLSGLYLRLSPGDTPHPELFHTFRGFLETLATLPEEQHDAAECLAALRALSVLGLDEGELPGTDATSFDETTLAAVAAERSKFVARVNRGITASGL